MNLTRTQIKGLVPALRALSGPAEKPFNYDEKTRYAIAKDLILLCRIEDATDKWRRAAIKAAVKEGEDGLQQGSPELQAFIDSFTAYLETTEEIPNFLPLDINALVKAGVPPDVIASLDVVLTGID